MITLCSAPGWMKVGGPAKSGTWSLRWLRRTMRISLSSPLRLLSDTTDCIARSLGELLPKVDYFDVWNEMKGFWDNTTNSWNVREYTTLYNDVYAAIKAVRPDAKVGGPYAPLAARDSSATANPSPIHGSFGDLDQRDTRRHHLLAGAQGRARSFVSMDGRARPDRRERLCVGSIFSPTSSSWLRTLDNTAYPGADQPADHVGRVLSRHRFDDGTATGQEAVAIDISNIVAGRPWRE